MGTFKKRIPASIRIVPEPQNGSHIASRPVQPASQFKHCAQFSFEWVFLHCVYANHVDAKVYRAMLQTPRFYFQTNESPRVKLVLRLALFPGWLSKKLTSFIFKDIRPIEFRFTSTHLQMHIGIGWKTDQSMSPNNLRKSESDRTRPTIQQLPTYCCRGPKSCQCSD